MLHLVPPHRVQRLSRGGGVNGVAVGAGDDGGVVGRLGPALQLQAVQTGFHELGHVVDHAHVPGVHNVGALVVLIDGEILPGTLLLHEGVAVAAGLGTLAPIGVPASHVVGQQAPARVAHAHGAVGKGLDLQLLGSLLTDLPDLLQAQLPGQDDPVGAQLVPGPGGLVVDDAGLGGDVALDVGGVADGQGQHAHVGQDHRVHPGLVQVLQPLGQLGDFFIAGHGVAGHVDPHPLGVAQVHGGFQLLRAEVSGEGTHAEGISRQIDGVGPVGQGHAQALHVPGRGQKLWFFSNHNGSSLPPKRRVWFRSSSGPRNVPGPAFWVRTVSDRAPGRR